jgi:FkbM family methyltransferase
MVRRVAHRIVRPLVGIPREAIGAWRIAADPRSFLRYARDIVLYRALALGGDRWRNRERQIRLRDGSSVTYRLNRGDIQTIREVWINETYRLPVALEGIETVVDLGANIGLASIYIAGRSGCKRLLAVEPDAGNLRLAEANFRANGTPGELVAAAVGPDDGEGLFSPAREANLGRLGDSGVPVQIMSMGSLLARLPDGAMADLVKLDIEGGEQPLLDGDRSWLARVRALMVEFHPEAVEMDRLIALIQAEGFRFIPHGSVLAGSADTFIREGEPGAADG